MIEIDYISLFGPLLWLHRIPTSRPSCLFTFGFGIFLGNLVTFLPFQNNELDPMHVIDLLPSSRGPRSMLQPKNRFGSLVSLRKGIPGIGLLFELYRLPILHSRNPLANGKECCGCQGKRYIHCLNGTLCATTRTLCCILENYQT
jgi:hypothetical protein